MLFRSGKISLGYGVTVGYYDQENRFLSDDNTVLGELEATYPQKTMFELRSCLARFLFSEEDAEKPISALSGGERARLTLAKLILKKVSLLVMDEPTNHLDIPSREALEAAIMEFPGTVVAVSHDRYFIDRVATRIAELSSTAENGVVSYEIGENEGAYTAYQSLRDRTREKQERVAAPSKEKLRYEAEKQSERDRKNLEKRKKNAALKVEKLEKELERLDEELFGEAATDYIRATEIEVRKAEIEEELLTLYELTMD